MWTDTPSRSRSGLFWLACLLFLLPVIWKLGSSDSRYHMEQMSILPSQETWLRMHNGEPGAWKTPSKHEKPRIRKPPLMIWCNLAAWSGLTPETSSVEQRIFRSRAVAALIGLLGLAATFGLGRLLYDEEIGGMATLVLATMYSILKQGRLATFDTHLLGWVMLGIFGILAFADHRPRNIRWGAFLLGTIGATAAVMTKGPVVVLYLLPALLLAKLMCPRPDFHVLRMIAPLFIAGCVYSYWLRHTLATVPQAAEILQHEITQPRENPQPFYYYLIVLGLLFPWTFLFFRSLRRLCFARSEIRFALLVPVLTLFLMSFAEAKRQRYAIPVLPFFALSLVLGIRILSDRGFEDQGRTSRAHLWEWLHAGIIVLVSIVLPFALPFQPAMVEAGWIKDIELPGAGIGAGLMAALLLLPPAALVWIATGSAQRRAVVTATAVWLSLAYTFAMHFYVESYHGSYTHRELAAQVHQLTDHNPIHLIHLPGEPAERPDDKFVFHSARLFKATDIETGDTLSGGFALVPERAAEPVRLRHPGWNPILDIDEGKRYHLFSIPPKGNEPP